MGSFVLNLMLMNRNTFVKAAYFPTIIIYSILVISCVHYAENNYYEIDTLQIEEGHVIGAATQDNTAVIIASEIPTDPRDPRILYQATRNNWPIYLPDMSEELVYRLKAVGADYLAIVTTQENIKNVY